MRRGLRRTTTVALTSLAVGVATVVLTRPTLPVAVAYVTPVAVGVLMALAWLVWPVGPDHRPLPPVPPLYGSDADVKACNTAPLDETERLAFLAIVAGFGEARR